MKIAYSLMFFIVVAFSSYGQSIDLTLRYNVAQSHYEVYAKPSSITGTISFTWGSSQITIVAPASVADLPFSVTAVNAGNWSDQSTTYAPLAAPGSDFHGIGSNGATTNLTADTELLLFTFTISGGACVPGLRLFINGSDPASDITNMPGDYTNVIYSTDLQNSFYNANYANTGTTCTVCNLIAPTLSK